MSEVTLAQLENTLSKTYSIKCFIDLADLTTAPSQAYKILQQHHQLEFLANDRLVFYTQHAISDQLIQHIYQAATLIDVSNFFLLLCSPFDISNKLHTLSLENHGDNVPFQSIQENIKNTKPLMDNFTMPDTLCPMPWTHTMIAQNGQVSPCCIYQSAVGNVTNDSLHDIFHNQDYVHLRQKFLSGEKVSECKLCWSLEDHGVTSNRIRHMRLLKKDLLTKYLDDPKIISLHISPGNTCNFKCRICNPTFSSLFAQEVQSISGILPIRSFNWAESDSKIMEEIYSQIPSLANIDMYGGEPFIIKSLNKLVAQAAAQGHAKHMRLHYNSNGSLYPDHLIDHWKQFDHVDIHFSIDNVGPRFDLERGGSWEQVQSNIRKLVDLSLPNLKISVMPTVSIMNILYLDEVLEWANELGLSVNLNYLDDPKEFNIKNLTADAKKLVFEKFQNHSWSEMSGILDLVRSSPDCDGTGFVNLTKHFDHIRGQNFSNTHAEIANAMGM
jgi:radical SAM protein with 4Fe4S-binding SPASM domain